MLETTQGFYQQHKPTLQDLERPLCVDIVPSARMGNGGDSRCEVARCHSCFIKYCIVVTLVISTPTRETQAYSVTNFAFDGDFVRQDFTVLQDASLSTEHISLNGRGAYLSKASSGRALYNRPVHFLNPNTNSVASFQTSFTFHIFARNVLNKGDGFAFGIFPDSTSYGAPGKSMGLFPSRNESDTFMSAGFNPTLAVEFDTHENPEFNDPSNNHVGVNWNSMKSMNATDLHPLGIDLIRDHIKAWIEYSEQKLSVWMTVVTGSATSTPKPSQPILEVDDLDLSLFLLPTMYIGFAGGIGAWNELHTVTSWTFRSSLIMTRSKSKHRIGIILGLCTGLLFGLVAIICSLCFFLRWRRRRATVSLIREKFNPSLPAQAAQILEPRRLMSTGDNMNMFRFSRNLSAQIVSKRFTTTQELDAVSSFGPRRYTYRELKLATDGFKETLGRGGFGSVFKGYLQEVDIHVAVKHVADDSKQGEREFLAEVSIIAGLRHRNLVQMQGWCHERGKLLLVYDYMGNGSLDKHLHEPKVGEAVLSWELRYNVVCQVASALAYLHDEAEYQIIHRDIKASNVLLDAQFNARLGDFGLARLSEHSQVGDTTVVAGTVGYLAPELVQTGKSTTKSDVFSFGVLLLEVMSGKRPVDLSRSEDQLLLGDWVWVHYESGQLLDVVDSRLAGEYDEKKMTWALQVGLMCLHPDPNSRPSIRFALQVLKGEGVLPALPTHRPKNSFDGGYGVPLTRIEDLLLTESLPLIDSFRRCSPIKPSLSRIHTAPNHSSQDHSQLSRTKSLLSICSPMLSPAHHCLYIAPNNSSTDLMLLQTNPMIDPSPIKPLLSSSDHDSPTHNSSSETTTGTRISVDGPAMLQCGR